MRNAYKTLTGIPKGKRPFASHMHKWDDNIKGDLREIVWEGVDWIHLAQDKDQWQALVKKIMNLRVL
jgi:hypothetical protein